MIKLIKDVSQCQSTCYFEFLPGIYKKKCWNKESVFIHHLQICYIEPIFHKHIDNYDHYSFMSVDRTTWQDITNNLNEMKENLKNSKNLDEFSLKNRFPFRDIENNFVKNFENSKVELLKMIEDFISWVHQTLKSHNKITVMGM